MQVGYEIFDGAAPATADAEVFAALAEALGGLPVRATTGDIGLILSAVSGLRTSQARKAALLRHLWRPRRFRALLDRFSGRAPVPAARRAILDASDPFAGAGPDIGLRSRAEVEARIATLRADAAEDPISDEEMALLDALLELRGVSSDALSRLRDIAVDLPPIRPAVDRMAARLDALAQRGVDAGVIDFEASYGRTSLEYYDGFVFGFHIQDRPELPPVATGGRYDALTVRLGQGRAVPAVGGVIRPDLMLVMRKA